MKSKNELNFRDLKMTCDTNIFNFETTQELEDITTGIGQERGIKALEFESTTKVTTKVTRIWSTSRCKRL